MSASEKRTKSHIIMVRAAPDELEQLREQALASRLTVPAYLLASALGKRMVNQQRKLVLEELRRLGAQQRELCAAGGGAMSAEYGLVLLEILAAMRRLGN